MAIPTSVVDLVRDYLFTQITALSIVTAPPPAGVQPLLVRYGPLGKYVPNDFIEVGTTIDQKAMIHNLVGGGGTGFLIEEFTVSVFIYCYRGGDGSATGTTDELVVWRRCKAISDAIDTMVRTDPSLGGNVNIVAWPSMHRFDSGWHEDNKGRVATCEYELTCHHSS